MNSAHDYGGTLFNSRAQRKGAKLRKAGHTIPLERLEQLLAGPRREAPPPTRPLKKPKRKPTPKRKQWPEDADIVKKEAAQ